MKATDFTPRKSKNVWIATCWFFIVSNWKLLLVHPTRSPDLSIPKWQIDNDENYFETAIRELYEETWININDLNILDIIQFDGVTYTNKRKTLHAFLLITDTQIDIKNLSCYTYVYDSNNNPLYPENDKFYMVDLYWNNSDSFFSRLHYSQKDILNQVYKIDMIINNYINSK